MTNGKISGGELAVIFFVSSISFLGSLTSSSLGENYVDAAIAALASAIVNLILVIPIIRGKGGGKIRPDSKILMWIYLLFFIYSAVADISFLIHMMNNTVFSRMNAYLFAVALAGAALYCAKLGLETTARCAQITVGVITVCAGLVLIASIQHIEFSNLRIPFDNGFSSTAGSFWEFFGRSMFLPQCVFLLANINNYDKFGIKFSMAVLLAGLFIAVSLILTILCLGCFSGTQEFPIFTLASFLKLSPLQRLDIFLGISLLSSSLIRLSVTFIAIAECCRRVFSVKSEITSFVIVLFVAIGSAFVADNPRLITKFCLLTVLAAAGIFLGSAIPQFRISAEIKSGRKCTDETS